MVKSFVAVVVVVDGFVVSVVINAVVLVWVVDVVVLIMMLSLRWLSVAIVTIPPMHVATNKTNHLTIL